MSTVKELPTSSCHANLVVSPVPISEAVAPESSLLRKLCLFVSQSILQFPLMFELQQKALDQPTLLRTEVEQELQSLGDDFMVIDYGCGSGTYTGLFSANNYLGIDCSLPMLERAAAKHPQHSFVQASDLSGIQSKLGTVGQILLVGVIHHLPEDLLVSILKTLPKGKPIKMLSIDTLKCAYGPGMFVQLFERGEFLRTEIDHKRLLDRVSVETSYKRVPYGRFFELAVYRGIIRQDIQ